MIASLDCRGILRRLKAGFLAAALLASPAGGSAAELQAPLPLMFDARERLSRPDLSTVVRVRILTTIDFPPFSFADQTGRLTGFNVDLAREVCAELKLETKCQIQALPFDELETALENNAGEAVMAGIAATPQRRNRFLFSRPYIGIPARFARNLSAKIEGETAAGLGGRRVGVVRNTTHEQMLKAFFPAAVAVGFDNDWEMTETLKEKTVDAVFGDGLRLPFWVSSDAAQSCCALFDGPYLSEKYLGEGMAVMVRKTDPLIADAFDQALATLSRNGRLQDLYLRYFPNGLY